jgi:hypothetical protein
MLSSCTLLRPLCVASAGSVHVRFRNCGIRTPCGYDILVSKSSPSDVYIPSLSQGNVAESGGKKFWVPVPSRGKLMFLYDLLNGDTGIRWA